MPGPPPPSKSYQLKIIDSSDEEDQDEDEGEDEEDYEMGDPFWSSSTNASATSSANNNNADSPTATTNTTASADNPSSSSSSSSSLPNKKNRKKKKKKKKRRNGTNHESPTTTTTNATDNNNIEKQKSVTFGTVSVRSFERVLGLDAVPADGGWPLGLGNIVPVEGEEEESFEVTVYEEAKQERLRIRAKERGVLLPDNCKHNDNGSPLSLFSLETRQWDYKYKSKNPLFHLLQEEQRMEILLRSSTSTPATTLEADELDGLSTHTDNSNNSSSHQPPKKRDSASRGSPDKKRRDSKNKNNHHHHNNNGNNNNISSHPNSGHHAHHHLHHTGHHINTRSSKRERSGSVSNNSERYNETFTQVQVHHVRNELEELRFHRTGVGHVGCTCRKLDVYLLPPNAGKKAHHRRMNVKRVKDELKKRHLLPEALKTREELELLLHHAVEKEPCCSGQDCPCVRNNIECQADVCGCWHDSHQTKDCGSGSTNSNSNSTTVQDIQDRCGNTNGMYVVDMHRIEAFRIKALENLSSAATDLCFICPPISPNTPMPPPLVLSTNRTASSSSFGNDVSE